MLIKQLPEDFVVEELIDLELNENGEQTYFWLTKRNWTTGKAISTIDQRCHNSMRRFKFAGFPNYFGEQRFGYGNTHLVGKEILKGNLEGAVKLIITYSEGSNNDTKIAKEFALNNWGDWRAIIVKFPNYMD